MSAHSSFSDVLAGYWSDDYAPLQDAGKAVLAALREDENAADADLYRRIGACGNGSHQYYSTSAPLNQENDNGSFPATPLGATAQSRPSKPPPIIKMVHERSVPLPPFIAQQYQTVKTASFMGLFPKAELAWLTVDDKLFIWPYTAPRGVEAPFFCSFTVPNGQCVLSVGLVRPKPGVFRPSVKWCLVVTTAEEVMLCALTTPDGSNDQPNENRAFPLSLGSFRLVPTRFSVPTDNVRMLCVCGSLTGRIFLGGEDGCLYEMAYENPDPSAPSNRSSTATKHVDALLEDFYDLGKSVPATITDGNAPGWASTGKRLLLESAGLEPRPRKCRKLNHSSNASSLAAVVPDFLMKATSFVFGGGKSSTGGGSIVKMVVDEERSCLYTLGRKGLICAFSLDERTPDGSAKLAASMNAPETARIYLDAVAKQRMTAPSSRFGNIIFAGGGSPAQKGVGGMDGARNILSLAKMNGDSQNVLMPVDLHVVPRQGSGRITLIAVTKGGLRYYISSLSTSTLSSGAARSSEGTEMLAPVGGKLSLCHIRAPPPLEEGDRTQDLTSSLDPDDVFPSGGFAPKMSNTVNKMPLVDASFCGGDTMVLAVRHSKTQSGDKDGGEIGDHIVVAAPDFVHRRGKKDSAGVLRHTAPGGLSETLSLPLCSKNPNDPSKSNVDQAFILPGGIVSDITPSSQLDSNILFLALNSRTPTDAELSVGLVPEFIPIPDDRSHRDASGYQVGTNNTRNGVMVTSSASLASTAMTVALNLIPNLILSRPLNHGITFRNPNYNTMPRTVGRSVKYHTSKRFGTRGFSLTAADLPANNKKQYSRKSPRLNPWLLRPAVVPLNALTLQHILPPTQVAVINSGGLHYFRLNSILSAFEEAIIAAGENVEYDEYVTRFFTSYGYPEGCAMCIMLALGFTSGGNNYNIKEFASRAASARGFTPKLTPATLGSNGLVSDSVQGSDPLLPNGYAFQPSALLDGVVKVTSRLLRPVWHKPLVVVTEGRTVMSKWKSEKKLTPSKLELLLDGTTCAQILNSLSSLTELMKYWFKQAIESVPGKLRPQSDMMDIDSRQNLSITDAFARQSHLRDTSGVGNGQLAQPESERLAKLTEERKIHSIYRLVSRTRQLLQLFTLLLRAHRATGLPEVEWGSLHGLTVSQLVQTREGQDRLEKMLNNIVTSTASYNYGLAEPSGEADQLATEFAEQCYLFFSPGSRYAYLGFSLGRKALACPEGSARRLELSAMATKHFQKAAKHWHSSALVTGRTLHTRSQENFEEVSKAAFEGGSPVAKAAAMLADLGEVDAIVDVCLITAANFETTPSSMAIVAVEQGQSRAFVWENDLYHKRQHAQQEQSNALEGGKSTPASPSSRAVTMGTSVTATDAITTCWFLIFYHMTLVLQRPELRPLGVNMVSRCASERSEPFLHAFFRHLHQNGHTDMLLQIASSDVERWLQRVVQDQDLLYKYYCIQGEYSKAGNLSLIRAKDDRERLSLNERIKWLSNAVAACSSQNQNRGSGWSNLAQMESEARDLLDIAKLQLRITEATPDTDMSAEEKGKLDFSLMKASDLFDFADDHCHYDICLLVMQTCQENNPQVIEALWRFAFCSTIFPCSTRDRELHDFLSDYQRDFSTDNLVSLLDSNTKSSDSIPLFEDGSWRMKLEAKVTALGRELYGKGADFVFPVQFLYMELEKLRRVYTTVVPGQESVMNRSWSMKILTGIGVRYVEVLGAIETVDAQEQQIGLLGRGEAERLGYLNGVVLLLDDWVRSAVKSAEVKQQLNQAFHSAGLGDKIRGWMHELERMNARSLYDSLGTVEEELLRLLRRGGVGMPPF